REQRDRRLPLRRLAVPVRPDGSRDLPVRDQAGQERQPADLRPELFDPDRGAGLPGPRRGVIRHCREPAPSTRWHYFALPRRRGFTAAGYSPRQTGARFSANAVAPSRASPDLNTGAVISPWRV